MLLFIARRLIQSIFVMIAVSLVAFSLFTFVGDPVTQMVGMDATLERRAEITKELGLDQPFIVQYTRFVERAVTGEFGLSLRRREPVSDLILQALPATLELVAVSAIIALVLGISAGVYTGINRDSWFSRTILSTSLVGISLPTFIIGIGLIYIFAVILRWLPSSGRAGTVDFGFWKTSFLTVDGWRSIILPAHALKNTLVPVITIIGLNIGGLVAFSVITETVFQWPGTGLMFIQAVGFADIPVMAAYLCVVALVFVVVNLIVDLLYVVIDPRIRIGAE